MQTAKLIHPSPLIDTGEAKTKSHGPEEIQIKPGQARNTKWMKSFFLMLPLLIYFLTKLGLSTMVLFVQDALLGICVLGMDLPVLGTVCDSMRSFKIWQTEENAYSQLK